MNRRALIVGGAFVGGALLDITGAGAKRRKRKHAGITAEGMTWKNTPLWRLTSNTTSHDVDVSFGYDDARLTGRIQAIITVPYGYTATLIQDITPTDWSVAYWATNEVKVTARFGGNGCIGCQSGIAIDAPATSSWGDVTQIGGYNAAYSVTTT